MTIVFGGRFDLGLFDIELRRAKRHAKKFLQKQATEEATRVLDDDEMFDAFVDECISQQSKKTRGAFADIISALIKSFMENPEAWIKIISVIISMFG